MIYLAMESLSAPHNVPAVLYIYFKIDAYVSELFTGCRTMRQNFVIDSLACDANCYRKLLPADVKDCLSCIIGRHIN
ncbi:hypothetical protein PAHAL_6G000400 [Panicum hallii]|jgi:hypothetical protein|uniref:Uncharacterized protein n=1 Tax=Panicum hallii TaxID=206008 RepID=A0A2S3HZD2_9POAL|nr:hypothetical protein PAHAL_6G000400 [Panicum hallii]